MAFHPIDLETWPRREYYLHFTNDVRCTYSLTTPLDITPLQGRRLYPALLWLLTKTVNGLEPFRTAYTPETGLGIYDHMHPSYTVFHKATETFSCIWTPWQASYPAFLQAYEADLAQYAQAACLSPKPGRPGNTFDVSMLPWTDFSGFNINVYDPGMYMLPIFTLGQASRQEGKVTIPLAIQIHHAVCDGYHIAQFLDRLNQAIVAFPG